VGSVRREAAVLENTVDENKITDLRIFSVDETSHRVTQRPEKNTLHTSVFNATLFTISPSLKIILKLQLNCYMFRPYLAILRQLFTC
jgi:hypothetical protein